MEFVLLLSPREDYSTRFHLDHPGEAGYKTNQDKGFLFVCDFCEKESLSPLPLVLSDLICYFMTKQVGILWQLLICRLLRCSPQIPLLILFKRQGR